MEMDKIKKNGQERKVSKKKEKEVDVGFAIKIEW